MRQVTFLIAAALTKLNAAEYLNLMSRLRGLIETATPEALGLTAEEFEEFKTLVDKLQDRIDVSSASGLTETLDLLNEQRLNVVASLFASIQAFTKLTLQDKLEAAKALELLTRPYANLRKLPDQQITVTIKGLERDLGKEAAQAHLTTLGLLDVYEEMVRLNDEYASKTVQRTSELDLQDMETVGELREKLDPMYAAVTAIAEAESIAKPTEATAEFIRMMNATIKEINKLYNLRTGKESDEDGKKDPTIPGTDTETPENPDGQQPTNPDGEQPGEDQQPGGEQTTPDPDDNTPQPGVDNDGDGSPEVV